MRAFACAVIAALSTSIFAQSPRPDIEWLGGGQVSPVVSVAYSPDGTMLASGGHFSDSTVKLWRESDGRLIRTLAGTNGNNGFLFGPMIPVRFFPGQKTIVSIGEGSGIGFWNVADGVLRQVVDGGYPMDLDPSGAWIATAGAGGTILVRDAATGAILRTLMGPTDISDSLAFSSNGLLAAGERTGKIWIWRVSDWSLVETIQAHAADIYALKFSPDGQLIASGSLDDTVRLSDVTLGAVVKVLNGHTESVNDLAFSPDGQTLVSVAWDFTARLWHVPDGGAMGAISLEGRPGYGVAFHPSGQRFAVATDADLLEFDLASHQLLRKFLVHTQPMTCCRFTPDSSRMISAGYDGRIDIWKTNGDLERQLPSGDGVAALDVSPDGTQFTAVQLDMIATYDVATGATVRSLNLGTYAYSASYSPDGTKFAAGFLDGKVRIYDASKLNLVQTLSGLTGAVYGVDYSHDGSFLVGVDNENHARVWDGQGNFVRNLTGSNQTLNAVAVSPDDQYVLAGGDSGKAYLWRVSTGQLVMNFTAHGFGGIRSVGFTPDGTAFYTGSGERLLKVWSLADGSLLNTYSVETGSVGGVRPGPQGLDVSPDGRWLGYVREDATVVFAHNALLATPTTATLFRGVLLQGGVADLAASDDAYFVVRNGLVANGGEAPVQVDLSAHTNAPSPQRLQFLLEARASTPNLVQEVWLRNQQTHQFELVDSRAAAMSDQAIRVDLGSNFARFVDGSGNLSARIKWRPAGLINGSRWEIRIDRASWSVGL